MKRKQQVGIAEKPEEKKEEIKRTYQVYDKNITLSDSDIIDYYKTRYKMLAMRFMLVGRFDDKGRYIIKDEIKYDLIAMYKEISDSGEDFYKASCRFFKKDFYFDIKISLLEEGKAKASLYLSEYVEDYMDDDCIVSHIADFVDVFDEHFRVKVRQVFNLVDAAITNEELKVPNLAVLMQDAYDINKYIGGLYDLASQIYVMRMQKLLESGDQTCHDILKRYKELSLNDEEMQRDEKHKFSRQKALLDRAIDEKGGLEKLNVNKEGLKSVIGEINKSVKAIEGLQNRPSAIEIMAPEKASVNGGDGGGRTAGNSKPKATKKKKPVATNKAKAPAIKKPPQTQTQTQTAPTPPAPQPAQPDLRDLAKKIILTIAGAEQPQPERRTQPAPQQQAPQTEQGETSQAEPKETEKQPAEGAESEDGFIDINMTASETEEKEVVVDTGIDLDKDKEKPGPVVELKEDEKSIEESTMQPAPSPQISAQVELSVTVEFDDFENGI